jgi:pyruvate dehydrogenase E1 component alpha subunit
MQELSSKEKLLEDLKRMFLIRNFELRAEAAYLQGKIGGFFHSYIGQEAIQTAALRVIGPENWWITSYRCHALALLLGATPSELMAELFGKEAGIAKGRGGSMHFYTERLLGGYGIVGGQLPIAAGAAFSAKYLGKKEEIAICFLGDGAVAQGTFHETLNLAALWNLPCLFVIENNHWSMGTPLHKSVSVDHIAERKAPSFGIEGRTCDGMNYFDCVTNFQWARDRILETSRPVLLEMVTDRFKGHSVSDPALYRTKESLQQCMQRDPIQLLSAKLQADALLTAEEAKAIDKQCREQVLAALDFAEKTPWPNPASLEEEVFAP